jgi:hypothetical protein
MAGDALGRLPRDSTSFLSGTTRGFVALQDVEVRAFTIKLRQASPLPGGILRRHADCAGPIAGGDSRSFAGKEHPVLDIAATVNCPKGGATVQTAIDLVASMASKRARFGALIRPAVGSDQREGSRGRHGSGAALLAVMEIQKPGTLAGCGRLRSL